MRGFQVPCWTSHESAPGRNCLLCPREFDKSTRRYGYAKLIAAADLSMVDLWERYQTETRTGKPEVAWGGCRSSASSTLPDNPIRRLYDVKKVHGVRYQWNLAPAGQHPAAARLCGRRRIMDHEVRRSSYRCILFKCCGELLLESKSIDSNGNAWAYSYNYGTLVANLIINW